ncbi:MAG: dTMP kinase [Acidimicrobiia bacterium]|nr:MAG: dTMP kinase [Acidimicrobiia bacterium]
MDDRSRFAGARYVAFEGIEGAGKSTIAQRVADHLRTSGENVVLVREPGGTEAGERIRDVLLTTEHDVAPRTEAALFAASRAQLVAETVSPALAKGAWVLSDRTAYSSLAYQVGGRGLPVDEVFELNDIALGGVWPDVVVLLRIAAGAGIARQRQGDRIGSESAQFHERVAQAFDDLAAGEPDRFIVVDASLSVDEVVLIVLHELGISS